MEVGDSHVSTYKQVPFSGFYSFFLKARSGIFSSVPSHILATFFLLHHFPKGTTAQVPL